MAVMKEQLVLYFVVVTILFSTGNANNPYAGGASILLINGCEGTIWPGVHTKGGQRVTPTGLKLDSEENYDLKVPDSWSGTIWARTGCSGNPDNDFHCDVGDCGTRSMHCHFNGPRPPVTQVKFNLAPKGGNSFYEINLKDGYNAGVSLTPLDSKCKRLLCLRNIKQECPNWLAQYSNDATKVACKSQCYTTGEAKHCCTGDYASPQKCELNEYTEYAERACPDAVSNAFDQTHFSCAGGV
ncbi:hypothetical protein CR513_52588, partial [Mucuna pruriens]